MVPANFRMFRAQWFAPKKNDNRMDLLPLSKRQRLADIERQSRRLASGMDELGPEALRPSGVDGAPSVSAVQLAQLCGVEKAKIAYRLTRGDLPAGGMQGNRREWSMEDAQVWMRELRASHLRPTAAAGVTLTVASFTNGAVRTTCAATLAQGLAMRGHRVLLVDLDPHAAATSLLGVHADAGVAREQTAAALLMGETQDLADAVCKSRWPGIDLVRAAPVLAGAELALPARQLEAPGFEFWRCLDRGLDPARADYDVIVIDAPPLLSHLLINALVAADGILMPLPPNVAELTSAAQFWELLSGGCQRLLASRGQDKTFEFVDVLLAEVDPGDAEASLVRQWVTEAYQDRVLPIGIPKAWPTASAGTPATTIYELARGALDPKTHDRVRDCYDRICQLVEQQIEAVWADQTRQLTG